MIMLSISFGTINILAFIAFERQIKHGVFWVSGDILLDVEKIWQLELVRRQTRVCLQQHQAGVGTRVDVQLIILIVPREASTCLLNSHVTLSVRLGMISCNYSSTCLTMAAYLGQKLIVDLSGHVGPCLYNLRPLLSPHRVGVHPLPVSSSSPYPGLRSAVVTRKIVVMDRKVTEPRQTLALLGPRSSDQELEFDSLSIKPLLRVGDPELVRHRLGQPSHLHLKVRGVVDDFIIRMSNPSLPHQLIILDGHGQILSPKRDQNQTQIRFYTMFYLALLLDLV